MKDKIHNIIRAISALLLYFIITESTGLIASRFKDNSLILTIIEILGYLVACVSLIFITRKEFSGKWEDFKKNLNKYLPIILKYWLVGLGIMFACNLIINIFILNDIAPNELANRVLLKKYPVMIALSACIFAPICEEIITRLTFKSIIKKRIPFMIFTGLLFGGLHMLANDSLIEMIYIIPYSALGMAFALILYDTNNPYSNILAHMIHNTITVMLLLSTLGA